MATLVVLPPLQLGLGAPWTARALGVLVAAVMFTRYARDWSRVYPSTGNTQMFYETDDSPR